MHVEAVQPGEREQLLDLAVATGLFSPDDASALLGGVLDGLAAGALPPGHEAVAAREREGGPPVGWAYFAPDPHADRAWNLWWIGVHPAAQGGGAGRALLRHAEQIAAAAGAAMLVIETSSLPAQARARRFYASSGYHDCGRIPDFYAEGDAKVVFARRIDRGA